jgi:hypothetical protein
VVVAVVLEIHRVEVVVVDYKQTILQSLQHFHFIPNNLIPEDF